MQEVQAAQDRRAGQGDRRRDHGDRAAQRDASRAVCAPKLAVGRRQLHDADRPDPHPARLDAGAAPAARRQGDDQRRRYRRTAAAARPSRSASRNTASARSSFRWKIHANAADAQRFAETVITELRKGAPFPVVAAQFSQTQTALQGGDLGWVQPNQLDPAGGTARRPDAGRRDQQPGHGAGRARHRDPAWQAGDRPRSGDHPVDAAGVPAVHHAR